MEIQPSEIKAIRKSLGLTQTEFGKRLMVGLSTVQMWESGARNPSAQATALIKQLKATQGKSDTHNVVNEAPAVYYKEMSVMHVPLVSQYAYAGYLSGYSDPEYIESLPTIPWADDVEHKGEYVCIEVRGDSMDNGDPKEAILEGDILLCRNVRQDYWKSRLHIHKWDFVILHKEDGILVKRIIKHDVPNGKITIHSLNEYYEDRKIDLREVAQIMNIIDIQRKRRR